MPDYAYQIKQSVSMDDVCEQYGVEVNRSHNAMCPFHTDTHPSLHIYPGNRGYHCFVCEANGSVIDFVMALFGVGYKDAVRKINSDFCLGLPLDRELTDQERKEADRAAYERRKAVTARKNALKLAENAFWEASDELVVLERTISENLPDELSGPNAAWSEAIQKRAIVQYRLDCAEIELYKLRHEGGDKYG